MEFLRVETPVQMSDGSKDQRYDHLTLPVTSDSHGTRTSGEPSVRHRLTNGVRPTTSLPCQTPPTPTHYTFVGVHSKYPEYTSLSPQRGVLEKRKSIESFLAHATLKNG